MKAGQVKGSTRSVVDLVLERMRPTVVVTQAEPSGVRSPRCGGAFRVTIGAEDLDSWEWLGQRAPIVKRDWPLVIYRDGAQGDGKGAWPLHETIYRQRTGGVASPAICGLARFDAGCEPRPLSEVKATTTLLAPSLWARLCRRGVGQRFGYGGKLVSVTAMGSWIDWTQVALAMASPRR